MTAIIVFAVLGVFALVVFPAIVYYTYVFICIFQSRKNKKNENVCESNNKNEDASKKEKAFTGVSVLPSFDDLLSSPKKVLGGQVKMEKLPKPIFISLDEWMDEYF